MFDKVKQKLKVKNNEVVAIPNNNNNNNNNISNKNGNNDNSPEALFPTVFKREDVYILDKEL